MRVGVCLFGLKSKKINQLIHLTSTRQKYLYRSLNCEVCGIKLQNLRNVVQYLESTSTMHLYPRYAKTGLSTMVRLGYHRSLVGRIASRPCLPQRDLAMQILKDYSSTPGQPYPLNVRLPFVPNLDSSAIEDAMPSELPFMKRHNLYQRVKKMLTT